MARKSDNKAKKLLLITSSGGGGHLQAAKAKASKALSDEPQTIIIEKDILIDCVGKHFGKAFNSLWNFCQKKGNLSVLKFLSKSIPRADCVLWVHIFSRILYTIIKEDVDQIIDTQPVGTSAIIKAIKCGRKLTRKPLKLEKILTELPTDKVIHFFQPIKSLSPQDRLLIKLISTAPLLYENQTNEAFWQTNCGLSEKDICYESFPLRSAFKTHTDKPQINNNIKIAIKVSSSEEKMLISNTINKGTLNAEIFLDKIDVTIDSTDLVSTILLGSHPAEEATVNYVKNFIKMTKSTRRHLLFVFCNHHSENKNSLLKRIHDLVDEIKDYPTSLNIIPMCFQGDKVIAPLYHRSDATFTRSGGLTSMELMLVAKGQIWIHSESTGKENLSIGMPIWEKGNALYLQNKKGAQFISPETFPELCASYFN